MVRPCGCRGSLAFVHEACLLTWMASSSNPTHREECPSCLVAYDLEIVTDSQRCQVATLCVRALGSMACMIAFSIATACALPWWSRCVRGMPWASWEGLRSVLGNALIAGIESLNFDDRGETAFVGSSEVDVLSLVHCRRKGEWSLPAAITYGVCKLSFIQGIFGLPVLQPRLMRFPLWLVVRATSAVTGKSVGRLTEAWADFADYFAAALWLAVLQGGLLELTPLGWLVPKSVPSSSFHLNMFVWAVTIACGVFTQLFVLCELAQQLEQYAAQKLCGAPRSVRIRIHEQQEASSSHAAFGTAAHSAPARVASGSRHFPFDGADMTTLGVAIGVAAMPVLLMLWVITQVTIEPERPVALFFHLLYTLCVLMRCFAKGRLWEAG